MELTRALRASSLARKTPLLPGLTAGKTACHSPAAATAGFFLDLAADSPVSGCARIDEVRDGNVSREGDKTSDCPVKLGTSYIIFLERRIKLCFCLIKFF